MSLPLAIALNIVLCVSLLAGLAWTMSRPRKLRPHVPSTRRRLSLVEQRVLSDEEQERRAA
ncbi:MAG TPA: hypothetical protein VNV44_05925 [Solirubrobacteraceae bacterium]|jgi:hypothetical protein|nr:hypothetical protein [Solirubrobacteraceae bacterium]